MNVLVLGGSNSRLRGGWVAQLALARPDLQIDNRAIGAATSVLGYCQLVRNDTLRKGDVVVWEYALNDESQIGKDRSEIDLVLRYVELILRFVAEREASFIPLVLRRKAMRNRDEPCDYLDRLDALFAAYKVDPLRANEFWMGLTNSDEVPEGFYANSQHYALESPVLVSAVEELARRVDKPHPVRAPAVPLHGKQTSDVRIVSDLSGGEVVPFVNSILELSLHRPLPGQSVTVRAGFPGDHKWRVLGVLALKNKVPKRYSIATGGGSARLRLFHNREDFAKSILAWVPAMSDRPVVVQPGGIIEITPIGPAGEAPDASPDHGIVAVHLERIEAVARAKPAEPERSLLGRLISLVRPPKPRRRAVGRV